MFDITLITMGKLKEKFYISAAEEYNRHSNTKGLQPLHLRSILPNKVRILLLRFGSHQKNALAA